MWKHYLAFEVLIKYRLTLFRRHTQSYDMGDHLRDWARIQAPHRKYPTYDRIFISARYVGASKNKTRKEKLWIWTILAGIGKSRRVL